MTSRARRSRLSRSSASLEESIDGDVDRSDDALFAAFAKQSPDGTTLPGLASFMTILNDMGKLPPLAAAETEAFVASTLNVGANEPTR